MKSPNNYIKMTVTLVFLLSAATWAVHDITEKGCTSTETQVQADNANSEIVLRPLTD